MQPTRQSGDQHYSRRTPEKVKRGAAANGAKLNEHEINELCAGYDRGASPAQLARMYGVSRQTVWRHVRARNTGNISLPVYRETTKPSEDAMTPRERAYILRIAAILETGENPRGAQNLARALSDLNRGWDDQAITAAVAYVRASILRIPFTTRRMEIAA